MLNYKVPYEYMPPGLPPRESLLQIKDAIAAVTLAYRAGDYAAALEKTEDLKNGSEATAPYCFFRGSILHYLGRFSEAEASLREGLFLEKQPRQRALAFNTLASVLTDQERYAEAIEFYENASRAWPDRGAGHRGIAEVWLRQGREFQEALKRAQLAVAIDKRATGISRELLEHRLGEDLAVLAWALSANGAGIGTVEFVSGEAVRLCASGAKAILAQVHCHIGQAYLALQETEKSRKHFCSAAEIDPKGIFGTMARSTIARSGM
jgi:tetratricopeptide (TPR) repeat protein